MSVCEEDILMDGEVIKPCYKVISSKGKNAIFGMEQTSGETVFIENLPGDEKSLSELSDFLNRNKVSVHHAKDVIRNRLLSFL